MKVIFTCGGTAGHVNPALALAGYMRKQDVYKRQDWSLIILMYDVMNC